MCTCLLVMLIVEVCKILSSIDTWNKLIILWVLIFCCGCTSVSDCLCCLQESVEATAEVSKTFNDKIRKYCDMTLLSCAYAGTGNVLKVLYHIIWWKYFFLVIARTSWCQLCFCYIGPALPWSVCTTSWEGGNLSRSCCTWNSYGIYGRRTRCWNGYSFLGASFTVWGAKYQKISPVGSWAPLHIKPKGSSRTVLKWIRNWYLLAKYVVWVNYSASTYLFLLFWPGQCYGYLKST